MMKILTSVTFFLYLTISTFGQESEKHLFILSGQSNMKKMPVKVFKALASEKLGEENVLVVKVAEGGQPISRWHKGWKSPDGVQPEQIGDIYDSLLLLVNENIQDLKIATITFIWKQGENDATLGFGKVYQESLEALIRQLREDLGREDINIVIGRISDYGDGRDVETQWNMVRDAQVAVAEADPRGAWVSSDDLNDSEKGTNRKHYPKENYSILAQRYLDEAIRLIDNN